MWWTFLKCAQGQSVLAIAGFLSLRGSVYISCLYQLLGCLLVRKLGFCETFSRELIVTSGMSLLSSAPKIDITQH